MDCESRDVLMPEVRLFLPEKISDRKSTKELGGEMTQNFKKKLLMAAMASPKNYYMQLGCVDGVLK